MNTFIRLLYSVLIASAVVAFVAIAIYTFYPSPKAPAYTPPLLDKGTAINQPIGDAYQQQYDKASEQYQADTKAYQRNVSIILVLAAIVVVALGVWLQRRADIIGEGLQLGGIGTSIYAVGMASAADDRVMRFVAVTLFLAAVISVVYFRFKEQPPAKASAKRK
jgi:hypothetical protein